MEKKFKNPRSIAKAILRGSFIAINDSIKKGEDWRCSSVLQHFPRKALGSIPITTKQKAKNLSNKKTYHYISNNRNKKNKTK
jgi:hypothetical protein